MLIFNIILSLLLGAALSTIIQIGLLPDGKSKHIPISWIIVFFVSSLLIFVIRTKLYT